MDRSAHIRFLEEQPDPAQIGPGDGVMITGRVGVHATYALVVARNDARQLDVEVDLRMLQDKIGRRSEMGLMGPFFARYRACQQALADIGNGFFGQEMSYGKFGHFESRQCERSEAIQASPHWIASSLRSSQ